MTCHEFRRLLVEDDRPEDALKAHAADCPHCAALLAGERALREAVAGWRERTSTAPDGLEDRVLSAYAHERAAGGDLVEIQRPRWRATPAGLGSWSRVGWLAAAAAVVIVVLAVLGVPRLVSPHVVSVRGDLLVSDALAEARRAERAHAEAIARLAEAAQPILARADDPATPPAEAALLRSYRDRLASLDDAIADVQSFLQTNPGHPGARTVLLAAYMDKTELLDEILARDTKENA
jgi:hypothetical protein